MAQGIFLSVYMYFFFFIIRQDITLTWYKV